VNRYNCVYWSSENPNVRVDKAVNLPGIWVWRGVSSRGVVGPFFFEGTVTGAAYLNKLQESTVPPIRQLYGDENMWYQQDVALPHYHRHVRAYPDNFSDLRIRTQRICWVSPMIARFNPTWLFLAGWLEERGVQHKASNTSRATARKWTVLGSRPCSKFGGCLSVSFSLLSAVPRS
jgi:hypothetical protein